MSDYIEREAIMQEFADFIMRCPFDCLVPDSPPSEQMTDKEGTE